MSDPTNSSHKEDLDNAVHLEHVCNNFHSKYEMDRSLYENTEGDYFVQVDPVCPGCGDKEIEEGKFIPTINFDEDFVEGDGEDGSEEDEGRDYRGP